MDEIGSTLKSTRESSGVSIEEASKDVEIKPEILENIESGNIGCFKDIYVLKDYISSYAKYLGLDSDKLIDVFNDYMFEYTSKIPVKEIEKMIKEQVKEETSDIVLSPYTTEVKKHDKKTYLLIYLGLILAVLLVVFWSVKQLTINSVSTNEISYVED